MDGGLSAPPIEAWAPVSRPQTGEFSTGQFLQQQQQQISSTFSTGQFIQPPSTQPRPAPSCRPANRNPILEGDDGSRYGSTNKIRPKSALHGHHTLENAIRNPIAGDDFSCEVVQRPVRKAVKEYMMMEPRPRDDVSWRPSVKVGKPERNDDLAGAHSEQRHNPIGIKVPQAWNAIAPAAPAPAPIAPSSYASSSFNTTAMALAEALAAQRLQAAAHAAAIPPWGTQRVSASSSNSIVSSNNNTQEFRMSKEIGITAHKKRFPQQDEVAMNPILQAWDENGDPMQPLPFSKKNIHGKTAESTRKIRPRGMSHTAFLARPDMSLAMANHPSQQFEQQAPQQSISSSVTILPAGAAGDSSFSNHANGEHNKGVLEGGDDILDFSVRKRLFAVQNSISRENFGGHSSPATAARIPQMNEGGLQIKPLTMLAASSASALPPSIPTLEQLASLNFDLDSNQERGAVAAPPAQPKKNKVATLPIQSGGFFPENALPGRKSIPSMRDKGHSDVIKYQYSGGICPPASHHALPPTIERVDYEKRLSAALAEIAKQQQLYNQIKQRSSLSAKALKEHLYETKHANVHSER